MRYVLLLSHEISQDYAEFHPRAQEDILQELRTLDHTRLSFSLAGDRDQEDSLRAFVKDLGLTGDYSFSSLDDVPLDPGDVLLVWNAGMLEYYTIRGAKRVSGRRASDHRHSRAESSGAVTASVEEGTMRQNVPGPSPKPSMGARTLLLVGEGTYRSSELVAIEVGGYPFSAIRAELRHRLPEMKVLVAGTPAEKTELVTLARALGCTGNINVSTVSDIRSVQWDIFVVPLAKQMFIYHKRNR